MNINSIKTLTWLLSASLAAGVSYKVWDFYQNEELIMGWQISGEQAKQILNSAEIPEGPRNSLVSSAAIERAYYFEPENSSLPNLLDWSGAAPRVVVKAQKLPDAPKAPVHQLLADVLTVALVQESMSSPDRSRAWVAFKPDSGVSATKDAFPSELGIEDRLPNPLQYATVKAISVEHGVTFKFDDEGREDETVNYQVFDLGVSVYIVGDGQPELSRTREELPRVDRSTYRPVQTVLIAENTYLLGQEDLRDFSDDFAGIIAREVRHSRHYNSKLGKYDGIELKEVKPGGRVAAHGGQSGDIIKSINGHAVTSSAEAISFVKNHSEEYSKWVVVIENKGKERTMIIENPPGQ